MKVIRTALKVGVAVGAVKAGKKVAAQYRKNNPYGVSDVNGDGVIDYKDKAIEIGRAAGEVFGDTAETVKKAVDDGQYKQKAEEVLHTAGQVIDNVTEKVKETIGK